jgi:general secretion pathway protein C
MYRRLFLVRNLLFLAGLAFLCAKITQAFILSQAVGPVPPLKKQLPPEQEAQDETTLSLRSYAAISRENVFNSESGEIDEEEEAEDSAPEPMEETELNVVLLGTAVGTPEDTFAVIEDRVSREQNLYQVGDTVQDEARIVKVSRCRVILKRDGSREVLECIEPDERHPRQRHRRLARRTPQKPDAGIRKVSRNRYWIDQERVDSALANMNRLMTQARIVPSLRRGKNQGWKLFAIRPNSLFKQIGLKNGDVIQSINGRNLMTPNKALEAFRELREASHFEVELMRRGRRRTLNYEIR